MARKNSPSSAMAKKMRGAVRIDPTSVLNVASITTTVTAPTPIRPSTVCAASAATSGDRAIWPSGSRQRYAAVTSGQLAVVMGTAALVALYPVVHAAYLYLLPPGDIARAPRAAADAGPRARRPPG